MASRVTAWVTYREPVPEVSQQEGSGADAGTPADGPVDGSPDRSADGQGPAARRRPFGPRLATFVVLGAAGVLFTASALASQGTDLRQEAGSDLKDLVVRQAQRVAVLTDEVGDLQDEVQRLAAEGEGAALEAAAARQAALAPMAGFTEVVGPSLTVALADAPPRPPGQVGGPGNPTPDDLVVHQQDVQGVVNALWRGGASAMRIMDQRVISTSAVRCVGNTLLLQGRVYSPPFVITAVGDTAAMRASLDADPTVSVYREFAALYGLGYDVAEEASTTLPAYDGPLALDAARPLPAAARP